MLLKATAFLQFLPQIDQAAKYKKILFKVAHIRYFVNLFTATLIIAAPMKNVKPQGRIPIEKLLGV